MKTLEEYKLHFQKRLFERYFLTISDEDYFALHSNFVGLFCKSASYTVGYVYIDGVKVFVLYMNELKIMPTCYPDSVGVDPIQTINACFSKPVRGVATWIYEQYLLEKDSIKNNFETKRDAAIFYFSKTKFPDAHIRSYENRFDFFRLMHQIKNIIDGDSKYAKLTLSLNDSKY